MLNHQQNSTKERNYRFTLSWTFGCVCIEQCVECHVANAKGFIRICSNDFNHDERFLENAEIIKWHDFVATESVAQNRWHIWWNKNFSISKLLFIAHVCNYDKMSCKSIVLSAIISASIYRSVYVTCRWRNRLKCKRTINGHKTLRNEMIYFDGVLSAFHLIV